MVRSLNPRKCFGRRAVVLFLFGVIWWTVGYGLTKPSPDSFSNPGPGGPLQFMDSHPWPGYLWIIGGILAITASLVRIKHPHLDGPGFIGLAIPPFVWCFMSLWSELAWLVTDGQLGQSNGRRALLYFAIFLFIVFIARWPDPDDPHNERATI